MSINESVSGTEADQKAVDPAALEELITKASELDMDEVRASVNAPAEA